jgi:hypothetical protein
LWKIGRSYCGGSGRVGRIPHSCSPTPQMAAGRRYSSHQTRSHRRRKLRPQSRCDQVLPVIRACFGVSRSRFIGCYRLLLHRVKSDSPDLPSLGFHPLSVGLGFGSNSAPGGRRDSALSVPPEGLPQQSVPGPGEQDPRSGSPQQKRARKGDDENVCDLNHPLAAF